MKTLHISWQRLVDEQGETCERCGTTETAVEDAMQLLKQSVKGLGVDVVLEKSIIDNSAFKENPLESNRIWIGGKSLEDWLSATTSESPCGTACGDSNCRTMIVDGKSFEAIPSELIVKAGLLASAQLLEAEAQSGGCSIDAGAKPQAQATGCGCNKGATSKRPQ